MLIDKYYVYFISCGDKKNPSVKIGIAKQPEKRILNLQVGNPCLLKLISTIECRSRKHAENLEHWLHKCFSKYHIRGEWFKGKYINVGRAIAGFQTDVELTNQKGKGIHGTKKDEKLMKLHGRNMALEKTVRVLNQTIDDELDRECLANMPDF